jgi:hypothetical protein
VETIEMFRHSLDAACTPSLVPARAGLSFAFSSEASASATANGDEGGGGGGDESNESEQNSNSHLTSLVSQAGTHATPNTHINHYHKPTASTPLAALPHPTASFSGFSAVFDSADPEFDEDSDPDADLDI